MRRFLLLAASAALLGACSDETPRFGNAVKTVAAGVELSEYAAPSGAFKFMGPSNWQFREDDPLPPAVTYTGPGTEKYPHSVVISVSRYPNLVDRYTDPTKFHTVLSLLDGNHGVTPMEKNFVAGREVLAFHLQKPHFPAQERKTDYEQREDIVLLVVPGGFYRLSHLAPVEISTMTMPIFDKLVETFKPSAEPIPVPKRM